MIRNYFKITWRNLVHNKVYSFINIGGLALGIFGSIVIFQFVKYHLGTDTYHKNAKNIYRVVMDLNLDDGKIQKENGSPFILHSALKKDFPGVKHSAYIGQQELTISVLKDNGVIFKYLEKKAAAFIDQEYFNLFDYQWLAGKPALLNVPNTVVLTENYARKYFGNTDPLNKSLTINNTQNVKVVGVLRNFPANTDFRTEIFVSLPTLQIMEPGNSYNDWSWFITARDTYILLNSNMSRAHFESQLPAFTKKYYGEMAKYYRFHLQELSDVHFNLDYGGKINKSSIVIFSFIGVLLIIISCINFINLSTAQSFRRFKEVGIRKTIGGTQLQLFWQFIAEIAIVTIISVLLALLFAYLATPVMSSWLNINLAFSAFFDAKLLLFLLLLFIFTVLTAGLYPSVVMSNFKPIKALKGIHQHSNNRVSVRKGLVVTQFSISFVLMAVSVLIVLQLDYLLNKDIGHRKELVLHVNIPHTDARSLELIKGRLLQKSFIENLSFSRVAPTSVMSTSGTVRYEERDWEKFIVRSKVADANYLDTYGIRLVSGRKPVASDTLNEIIVNQQLVKELGLKNPGEALNKRLVVGAESDKTGIIVGVVSDFNNANLYSGIEPTIIYSSKERYQQLAIKLSNPDYQRAVKEIATVWETVYPNHVFEYSFYDQELARFYEREALTRSLIISFAIMSVFISCMGLFGLVSLTISQRTKEIGIRKVLGAGLLNITTLVSKTFIQLVIVAIVIASPVAYYFMYRWLQGFAYRTEISWWIFIVAGTGALLITLLTICFQVIRAAMANPVKSLRTE